MSERKPHVSDHALLRYLERVVGIDVAGYRHEVERKVARGVEMGASAVVSEGFRYVLVEWRVTTVSPVRHDFPQSDRRREE